MSWYSAAPVDSTVSRWIRCLFHTSLVANPQIAENLLDQVIHLAKSRQGTRYPREELEWIATTTFNHAIDLYCAGDDVRCRQWAEKAILLAHLMDGNSGLHELLQSKFVLLEVKAIHADYP